MPSGNHAGSPEMKTVEAPTVPSRATGKRRMLLVPESPT